LIRSPVAPGGELSPSMIPGLTSVDPAVVFNNNVK